MAVGYVLVNVSPGNERNAFESISGVESVKDVTMLFGDYDIIAKLEADNLGDIAKTVVEIIRQIPGVTDTKTLAGAEF
jgi:DNA-binding Lrp family transcriptional regulator